MERVFRLDAIRSSLEHWVLIKVHLMHFPQKWN